MQLSVQKQRGEVHASEAPAKMANGLQIRTRIRYTGVESGTSARCFSLAGSKLMSLKQRLRRGLVNMRQNSERLLADFKTPEQWTFQVHPACNHALWFVGHMATSDNFFLSLVAPDKAKQLPEFQAKFGMGS